MEIAAVVGLGNPGEGYGATRHNLGFRVVDEVARRWRAGRWRAQYHGLVARRAGGRPVVLIKPQTYMNLSGECLAALCRGEFLVPQQCLVVVDDVDLPLGQLRLRERGGPGSHNGLRSVTALVGEDIPRLRLGIRGEAPWQDLAEYVLAPFESDEEPAVDALVGRAADCVEAAVREGLRRAAARFNSRERETRDENPPEA